MAYRIYNIKTGSNCGTICINIFHRVFHIRPAIHIIKYATNEKCIAGYFMSFVTFLEFRIPFFAFRILRLGQHSCEKSKDFVVYFFAALKKHEIRMKYEKCIASVSYFAVCFVKTHREIQKCIASLKSSTISTEMKKQQR